MRALLEGRPVGPVVWVLAGITMAAVMLILVGMVSAVMWAARSLESIPQIVAPALQAPSTPAAPEPSVAATPDGPPAAPPPPVEGEPLAHPAAANGGTSSAAGLRYHWTAGREYICRFEAEASVDSAKHSVAGTTLYVPTSAEPAALARDDEGSEASGTGFVVHPDGVLATCAHLVLGATEIQVRVGDRAYPATVLAYDGAHDLALVRVAARQLPYLPVFDSDQVELGQDVRVVGYPLSDVLGESVKISKGSVCGVVARQGGSMFQIDASIHPGSSGSPLVDEQGRVLGLASALLSGQGIDSVGFVVPSNQLVELMRSAALACSSQPEGPTLTGPDLARRVTPAVALMKVRFGPGGYGMEEQHVVRYTSTCSAGNERDLDGEPPAARSESGQMVVDARGEIAFHEGRLEVSPWFELAGRMGIETLAGNDSREWESVRVLIVQRAAAEQPREPWEFGAPVSPYRPPLGPFRRPPLAPARSAPSLVSLPMVERTKYEIVGTGDGGLVEIRKSYELAAAADQQEGSLTLRGSGTVWWDPAMGIPQRGEMEAELTALADGAPVCVPLSLRYRFEDRGGDDLAVRIPSPASPSVPPATAATEEEVPVEAPLPFGVGPLPLASDPIASGPATDVQSVAPSAGLSLYRPE